MHPLDLRGYISGHNEKSFGSYRVLRFGKYNLRWITAHDTLHLIIIHWTKTKPTCRYTVYIFTPSIGNKRLCSQVLLSKSARRIYHQPVWAPLKNSIEISISKWFGVHHYTVRPIIAKWTTLKIVANPPKSRHSSKFSLKARPCDAWGYWKKKHKRATS